MKLKNKFKQFNGSLEFYTHNSQANKAAMSFAVFLPQQIKNTQLPVLYWLSGLTCTEENFMIKAGATRMAAELGIVLVTMDTSPRNLGIEGEDDSYDFGSGAGFYLNATDPKWSKHYNMYDYITNELPKLIEKSFNVNSNKSIFGHSMGGHGALSIALKNPSDYLSVSAFSPIVAPSQTPWGRKAFKGYLGDNPSDWLSYDSCELVKKSSQRLPILIDQGTDDEFLKDQLQPELLKDICDQCDYPLKLRYQDGYDHSYYFISTFIDDHLKFHADYLFK
jgi:S-formylglutathione hydrolase